MTEVEKEQKKIYDEQLKKFMKDRKANAALKAKPMSEERISFKQFMLEAKKPHDDTEEDKALIKKLVKPEALKEEELDEKVVSVTRDKQGRVTSAKTEPDMSHSEMAKKLHQDADDAWDVGRKHVSLQIRAKAKEHEKLASMKESVFDWKGKPSIFSKKDEPTKSAEGGTVYKARETARNAETGGAKEKQSVGRPKGEYGSYKIDKAKRDDPKYKEELSKKVMAAKADGNAVRAEYKKSMHDAILRHQLKLSGIDPKDHEAQIAKKNPVKK